MDESTTPIKIVTEKITKLINSGNDDMTLLALEQLADITVGMGQVNRKAQEVLTRYCRMLDEIDKREKDLGKLRDSARIIINVSIPKYLSLQQLVGDLDKNIYVSPTVKEQLIDGQMRAWSWLQKAFEKSKSICRVWVNGKPQGSGFIDKDGYLYTCNHVLPSAEKAKKSLAEFNFDHDKSNPVRYDLDASDFITDSRLDYTKVKIINQEQNPLSKWGFIEMAPTEKPSDRYLNIIHHPGGKYKHFSLLGAYITLDKQLVRYDCDTDNGSSGSPVFNDDWKAIAIHRGSYPGPSNGGTLLYYILEDIKVGKKNQKNLLRH